MDSTNNTYFLPIAIILAGLFIGGAVIWNGMRPAAIGAGPGSSGAAPALAPAVDIADINLEGSPYIGNPNAPLAMAVWSDFQCPYCKQFEVTTLPQIIEAYVSTGKLRVVFMDFPFQGSDSIDAARYNQAVWKLYPAQYAAWRAAMYNAQDQGGNQGFGNAASIDTLNATIPGLDAKRIKADVEANAAAYDARIAAERDEGQKVGVNATPSIVVGTELIQGALPFADFKAVIDRLIS
jgi:protein-disulfide isomerase